jgi:formylglycine-generating enzyme required for sulfatase activity
MAEKRYRAFISYSQKDKAHARRMHGALGSYRLPRGVEAEAVDPRTRKLGRFFRDDEEMGAATDLGATLQGAIADAESLVVICSPHAARSHWVNEEIIHFKRTGRADRIFAVIVAGQPNAGHEDNECFPPALRFELGSDGALVDRPAQPLALDVRKESYNRLVVRLAASLVRTPFDALWRREQRRTRARAAGRSLVTLLVALIIGMAATQNLWRPRVDAYLRYTRYVQSSAALMAASPGTTFQDCQHETTYCPVMVVIPEGTFVMGQAPEQIGIDEQGRPQFFPDERRRMSVERFAMSRNEVTFANWLACVRGGGCEGHLPNRSSREGDDYPVINVSWEDAKKYVAWLSHTTGHEYRLPSESEWEYAARGVTSADDPRNGESWGFGNDESQLGDYAWYGQNSDYQSHPAGTRRANRFGLYDMHGSVWEWVEDCGDWLAGLTEGSEGDTTCSYRIPRGGAFSSRSSDLRSGYHGFADPTHRVDSAGFRVARTL